MAANSPGAPWIVRVALGRFAAFYGAIFLGIGGLALTVAWHAGPQKFLEARKFATLTARANARIVESWVAVEFDPAQMGKYPYWRPFAKASPCVIVEYPTTWAGAARAAYCGTRVPFADHYRLHKVTEVTPGVPFYWARDERGFIVPEIRMSAEARQWLATHGANAIPMPDDARAGTELAWLRHEFERPDDDAIAGWGQPEPAFPVAFGPAKPSEAWPVGYIDDAQRRKPDWVTAAIGFLIGGFAWVMGWKLIVGTRGKVVLAVVVTVTLVALPWWGEAFPRWLRSMNAPFGGVIAGMLEDVDAQERLVVSKPDDATLVHGERIAWRTAGTIYADTFGTIPFKRPEPPPANADAALNALADNVAARMRAQSDAERSAILERLTRDKREGRSKAGYVFLRAAREAFMDAQAGPAVHEQARQFLEAWVTQPVEDPFPTDVGFETRLRLLRELMAIPQPNDIAIPSGWIVERGEARRAEQARSSP